MLSALKRLNLSVYQCEAIGTTIIKIQIWCIQIQAWKTRSININIICLTKKTRKNINVSIWVSDCGKSVCNLL